MNDFTFQNPTKVYFGKDQLKYFHEEVLNNGKNVLLVYGGHSFRHSPLYDKVKNELQDNEIEVFELGSIEPNPRHTSVNKGAEIIRSHGIKTILAVGGGSVIDAAKAMSAPALSNTDDFWNLAEGKVEWTDSLPVIAMPTIASTGSEMDKSCVISNIDKGIKSGINGDKLRPKAAFLNPENTYTVPAK